MNTIENSRLIEAYLDSKGGRSIDLNYPKNYYDWNLLIDVIREIECDLYNMNYEYVEGFYTVEGFNSLDLESIEYISDINGLTMQTDIEFVYKDVVKIIEWLNRSL